MKTPYSSQICENLPVLYRFPYHSGSKTMPAASFPLDRSDAGFRICRKITSDPCDYLHIPIPLSRQIHLMRLLHNSAFNDCHVISVRSSLWQHSFFCRYSIEKPVRFHHSSLTLQLPYTPPRSSAKPGFLVFRAHLPLRSLPGCLPASAEIPFFRDFFKHQKKLFHNAVPRHLPAHACQKIVLTMVQSAASPATWP